MSNLLPAKKSLGQHFLRDPNTASRIADLIVEEMDQFVVEIGPGDGFLTHHLLQKTKRILAIELDQRAVAVMKEKYPEVDVIHMDVLKADWSALRAEQGDGEKLSVVGNLPYYITSQILFSLLKSHGELSKAVIMSQLEVARRIVAVPRTKDYGILGVVTQLFCKPKLEFKLSPGVFRPRPRVDSAIVSLDFTESPVDLQGQSWNDVFVVVKAAFGQRRKTLRNALSALAGERGVSVPEEVKGKRAEELTPEQFVDLSLHFKN